jgi:dolichyl-phosphate beta-glucosyltransferase
LECRTKLFRVVGDMVNEQASLTVVIPAFNEARRLGENAGRFKDAVERGILSPHTTEMIIVDDGSTDETGWKAEELLMSIFPRLRVLRLHDNAGKGAAVRLGTAAATAPVVLFMDADMSVDPTQIPGLVKAIGPADIAIGSRSLDESLVVADGFRRILMGRSFNVLVSTLTRMPFRDTQCGFKAFRTPMARILFHLMRVQRFAFDVEVLCLARQLRMDVAEVAVRWREVGQSTVRSVMDPLSMTRDVLGVTRRQVRPNHPALAVTPSPGERRRSSSRVVGELRRVLGPTFPILVPSEDQTVVLLPLCSPLEVHNIASRLRSLDTKLSVRERSVSFNQLVELAPLKWRDGEDGGIVIGSRDNVNHIMTYPPVGGWESVRAASRRNVGSVRS